MAHRVIDTLIHASGKFRVIIFRRDDGTFFGFEDQKCSDEPREQCWIPRGRYSEAFCDSAERATSEARGRVDWLAQPDKPPSRVSPTHERP